MSIASSEIVDTLNNLVRTSQEKLLREVAKSKGFDVDELISEFLAKSKSTGKRDKPAKDLSKSKQVKSKSGDSDKKLCQGMKAGGARCTRGAKFGDFCKTHLEKQKKTQQESSSEDDNKPSKPIDSSSDDEPAKENIKLVQSKKNKDKNKSKSTDSDSGSDIDINQSSSDEDSAKTKNVVMSSSDEETKKPADSSSDEETKKPIDSSSSEDEAKKAKEAKEAKKAKKAKANKDKASKDKASKDKDAKKNTKKDEPKKRGRGRPKKKANLDEMEKEDHKKFASDSSEDEENSPATKITVNGKDYLLDSSNDVYSFDVKDGANEFMGKYDKKKKKIIFENPSNNSDDSSSSDSE